MVLNERILNMEAYLLLYAIVALALGAIAGSISERKGRGFAVGFVSSLLLTPLIGIVIALVLSPDKDKLALIDSRIREERKAIETRARTLTPADIKRQKVRSTIVLTVLILVVSAFAYVMYTSLP